jgi:hypothetical protein
MFITYWLIDSKGEMLSDADSIDDLKGLLGDLKPGRYSVDEISSKPLPSGHTARRWGVLLKLDDGTIIEEPDPWGA